MNQILDRLILALRKRLHLSAIESDIAEIKNTLVDQELRAGAGQALLANHQQHLDATIGDLNAVVRELSSMIVNERCRKGEVEMTLARSLAELTNEIRRLGDALDKHLRATNIKQSDK